MLATAGDRDFDYPDESMKAGFGTSYRHKQEDENDGYIPRNPLAVPKKNATDEYRY